MLVEAEEETNRAKSSLTPAARRLSPTAPPAELAFSLEVGDPADNEKPAGGSASFPAGKETVVSKVSAADNMFAEGIIIFRCSFVLLLLYSTCQTMQECLCFKIQMIVILKC